MSHTLRTIILSTALLVLSHGLCVAAPGTPVPESLYLELHATYPLEEMGTGISISASAQGEVVVADASRSKYYRVQQDGKGFEPITLKGIEKRFVVPQALCHDDNGSLWIANPLGHEVLHLASDGSLLHSFSSRELPLEKPLDLACGGTDSVFVLDAEKRTVLEIREKLDNVDVIRLNNLTRGATPVRLTVDRNQGRIVVSTDRRELFQMDRHGNLEPVGPAIAENRVELGDIESGLDSLVFATAPSRPAILAYDASGRLIQDFLPVRPLLLRPTSLTIRGSDLWLVDEGKKVVYRFTVRTAVTGMEHQILGEEHLALHYPEVAAIEFERAHLLGRDSFDLRLAWGQALYAMKEFQRALDQFKAAEAQKSENPEVALWLGQSHNALGLMQEAEKDYLKTVRLAPDHALAHYYLGMLYLAENKLDLAEVHLNRALQADTEDRQACLGLGRVYLGQKKYGQAREVFGSFSGPEDLLRQARYYIGLTYLFEGKPEQAIPYLERAGREGPFFSDAFHGLGTAYRLLNLKDKAENSYRKALEINPQHAEAKKALKEMQ